MRLSLLIPTLLSLSLSSAAWQVGDIVPLECPILDSNGNFVAPTTLEEEQGREGGNKVWGKAPICRDTLKELSFQFGVNTLTRCPLTVDNSTYEFFKRTILGNGQYVCRIPMAKNGTNYIPFPISLWGMAEKGNHIHLMNHFQYIFHVRKGFFYGAVKG